MTARRARGVGVGVAVLLLTLLPLVPARAQGNLEREIESNQARLDSIRQERSRLQSQLTNLRGRMRNISSEIDNIERQKLATNRLVNELDRQMSTLGAQLDTVTIDLLLAQDELAEKRAVEQRRIVEIYKRGPLWTFQVLLAAESFSDLLSRYKYLYLVSRQDQALVGQVAALRDRVAHERRNLEIVQGQLAENRDERGRELERYARLEQERQQSLRQTRSSEAQATARLSSLADAEQKINDLIAELERKRREAIAAGRIPALTPTITRASLGKLRWPVDGPLVFRFGPAPGPSGTTIPYQGIGIGAPVGTPVHVVADGQVEFAGPFGTYGLGIMVNHGGGFHTLYLNLSRTEVTSGQMVRAGDVVGLSGGSASENGPHMEFQIREAQGNQPVALDPLNWLTKHP